MKMIKVHLDVDGKEVEYEFKASLNILKQAEQLSGISFTDAFHELRTKDILPLDYMTALIFRGASCNGYPKNYEYFLDNQPYNTIPKLMEEIAMALMPDDMQPNSAESKADSDSPT